MAPTLPSIEVEVEAEVATRELGGAAPITGRATNQARAPSRANNARGMDWQTDKHVDQRDKREAGDFPGPLSAGVSVAPASVGFPEQFLVGWICCAPVRRASRAARHWSWSWFTE